MPRYCLEKFIRRMRSGEVDGSLPLTLSLSRARSVAAIYIRHRLSFSLYIKNYTGSSTRCTDKLENFLSLLARPSSSCWLSTYTNGALT
jgi:hypothetical protein